MRKKPFGQLNKENRERIVTVGLLSFGLMGFAFIPFTSYGDRVIPVVTVSSLEGNVETEEKDNVVTIGVFDSETEASELPQMYEVIDTKEVLIAEEVGPGVIQDELPEETEAVKVWTKDDFEVDLLARVLDTEARGEDALDRYYVGSVVLNRIADPRFPDNMYDVIYQKGQYASKSRYYKATTIPTEETYAIAIDLMTNGPVLPPEVVWQSQRKQGKGVYVKTRVHYYCY